MIKRIFIYKQITMYTSLSVETFNIPFTTSNTTKKTTSSAVEELKTKS